MIINGKACSRFFKEVRQRNENLAKHSRKTLIASVCVVSAGIFVGCARHPVVPLPNRPEVTLSPELDLSVKKPTEYFLPNGLHVMFIHDDSIPMVHGKFFFRGGSLNEHDNEVGIASAVGEELRDGGVEGISPDELDRRLDSRAASIGASVGEEFGTVAFSSLSEDFEEIFGIFRKVVREPSFDHTRLELWKTQAIEGIKRRKESPDVISSAVFHQILFGANSPYGAVAKKIDISKISPESLRNFYDRVARPDGSILVVVGSFDEQVLKKAVEREFGDWLRGRSPVEALPVAQPKTKRGIYVVEGSFNQASILIGHQGPVRLTPDSPSIGVFNRYFGFDAFGSKLFSEIRSKLGLAYSVNGAIIPGAKIGTAMVVMGTRSNEALRSVEETLRVIDDVRRDPPTEQELERIKTSTGRTFVFNFSTADAVATRAATLELLNYPKGYDEGYLERMSKVTPQSVLDVARNRLKPDEDIIVVVGNVKADDFQKKFGDRFSVTKVRFDEAPIFPNPSRSTVHIGEGHH